MYQKNNTPDSLTYYLLNGTFGLIGNTLADFLAKSGHKTCYLEIELTNRQQIGLLCRIGNNNRP